MSNVYVRYVAGLGHDVASLARPERLERNTRRLARFGRWVPDRTLARGRRGEAALASRMNRVFERADVVLTPIAGGPAPVIDDLTGHGLLRSLYQSRVAGWAAPWNAIGQPAASVPVGFDGDGLPLAVQLCGRPNDEMTLLRVAAQLEAVQPWALHRPPVDAALAVPGG
jgi:amidase